MAGRAVTYDGVLIYIVTADGAGPDRIDLTDDELADYQRVCGEFDAWQDRLRDSSA